jgi:hypothetical protein
MSEEDRHPHEPFQFTIRRLATSILFVAVFVLLWRWTRDAISHQQNPLFLISGMFSCAAGAIGSIFGKGLKWALIGLLMVTGVLAFVFAMGFLADPR